MHAHQESPTHGPQRRMRMRLVCLLIAAVCLTPGLLLAQEESPLLQPRLRDLFHEALSGELAKEHVIAITRHHRIQGSRGYRDAANYVLQQLRDYGFSAQDAYIETFPSDGKTHYQTWQSPSGWDIEAAELRMLEPYEERIVGYPEIAMSVITYSNPGEATAELVWVGSGTRDADYAGKDVRGKFVLATGYGGAVHRLAVLKYGAKAVVCFLDDERAQEYPDMLAYTGMWPRTEELDRVTFGFNITNRQGEKLRDLLRAGEKVVLRGWVKGIGLEPYFMDVVVAEIRGSERPDETLVFSAHLDHPKESANDNASGSAAILDIARTLKELIDSGRLPRPKRSLRFLWVPEWYGTMAYIDAHPELRGPALDGVFLANLNLDMVGEHLEFIHSELILTQTPASIPSVLNDVVADLAAMVDAMEVRTPRGSLAKFNYEVIPYSGGSDHMMFIERKIPGMMFSHRPDYTHHTSEDTPDKVDPAQLERCEIIATGAMWYLANLSERQAIDLVYLCGANRQQRLGLAARRARAAMVDATDGKLAETWRQAKNLLEHETRWAGEAVASVLTFHRSPEVERHVAWMTGQLQQQRDAHLDHLHEAMEARSVEEPAEAERDDRVPVRTTRGPLAFDLPERALPPDRAAWYKADDFPLNANQRFELINFVDSRRSVSAIRDALSAEYGPLALATVRRYLEDLVRAGMLRWRE